MPNTTAELYNRHSTFLIYRYGASPVEVSQLLAKTSDIAKIYVFFMEKSPRNIPLQREGEQNESTILASSAMNRTLSLRDEQILDYLGWPKAAIDTFKMDLEKTVTQATPANQITSVMSLTQAAQLAQLTQVNQLKEFGFNDQNIINIRRTPNLLAHLANNVPMFKKLNFDVDHVIHIVNTVEDLQSLLEFINLPDVANLKPSCDALVYQANANQLPYIINNSQTFIKIKELFVNFSEVLCRFPAQKLLEYFDGLSKSDYRLLKRYHCQSLFTQKCSLKNNYSDILDMMIRIAKDVNKDSLYKFLNANLNDPRIYRYPNFPQVYIKLSNHGYSDDQISSLLIQLNHYSCTQALHLTQMVRGIGFNHKEAMKIFNMSIMKARGGFVIYDLISNDFCFKTIKNLFTPLEQSIIEEKLMDLQKNGLQFNNVQAYACWNNPNFTPIFPEPRYLHSASVTSSTSNYHEVQNHAPASIGVRRPHSALNDDSVTQQRTKRAVTTAPNSTFFPVTTSSTPVQTVTMPEKPRSAFVPVRPSARSAASIMPQAPTIAQPMPIAMPIPQQYAYNPAFFATPAINGAPHPVIQGYFVAGIPPVANHFQGNTFVNYQGFPPATPPSDSQDTIYYPMGI